MSGLESIQILSSTDEILIAGLYLNSQRYESSSI